MTKPLHYVDINQISFFHSILREILVDIYREYGPQVITSLYRTGENETIHKTIPLRAVDIGVLSGDLGKHIEDYLNRTWIYNPGRPERRVAIWHDVGKGLHLHIQVNEKTRRRDDPVHA